MISTTTTPVDWKPGKTIQQDNYYRPSGIYIPPDPELDIGV